MKTIRTISSTRPELANIRSGRSVGLVPTMGAIHDGHLSLIKAARDENQIVVVSIFVNPTQFGPTEDLATYPRDEAHDLAACEAAGVDFVFAPEPTEMYPADFQTWVDVEEASRGMEGDARPGHFRGVATVCLKLFNIIDPDRVYFGQKDLQQSFVVEQLVRDLNVDLEVRVMPTVRDVDGLALSSRNAHLSRTDRAVARAIPEALTAGKGAYTRGSDPIEAASAVLDGEPGMAPDYVELSKFDGRLFLAIAASVGDVRLIDNIVLEGGEE